MTRTPEPETDAARRAWKAIGQLGGLVGVAELAAEWQMKPQAVRALTKHGEFPLHRVRLRRGKLWLRAEVAMWRQEFTHRPGKPGPPPRVQQDEDNETATRCMAAVRAWNRLQVTGGLVTRRDLEELWGATNDVVRHRIELPAFPKPCITRHKAHAWIAADVERWRRHEVAAIRSLEAIA